MLGVSFCGDCSWVIGLVYIMFCVYVALELCLPCVFLMCVALLVLLVVGLGFEFVWLLTW